MGWKITISVTVILSTISVAQNLQESQKGQQVQLAQPIQSVQPIQIAPPPLLFLFRDDKANRIGDLVTVLVTQTANASERSQTQTSKSVELELSRGTGGLKFIPSLGLEHSSSFGAQAQGRKSVSIVTTIACRVIEIAPTGLLKIEGMQELTIDKRKQIIKLTGWVRPQDISPNNTILSTQVSDARLEFKGDWRTRKGKNFLEKIVEGFNRLLRILF